MLEAYVSRLCAIANGQEKSPTAAPFHPDRARRLTPIESPSQFWIFRAPPDMERLGNGPVGGRLAARSDLSSADRRA
ncbi:hypothetical protein SS05631_c38260 [Sinorhizobium sp. CCBAU 05631]|nr:hypothetical protein SS05631_c38260 [Sinorhizobium sp. CCBAU 05631]